MGCGNEGPRDERRRDQRLALSGRVRLTRPVSRSGVQGRIVDVSAGGVRASFPPKASLHEGQTVRFELFVGPEEARRTAPPPVKLSGRGTVVRTAPPGGAEGEIEVAVRFAEPLSFAEAWPAVRVF